MKRTSIVLQDRDIALLRTLAEDFQILSREQIEELFPMGSRSRVNFRLKQLRDASFLSFRELTRVGNVTRGVYYLGPQAQSVFEPGEKNAVELARAHAAELAESGLAHRLLVIWLHIRFLTTARTCPEFRLHTWIDQYSPWWQDLRDYGVPFQADAYAECLLVFGFEHLHTFFLEVDRGTERGLAIRHKLDRYVQYAASGTYERQFAARAFRVLFVTTSVARMERLLRLMANTERDLFWITTWDRIKHSRLLDPVWRRPYHQGEYSLNSKP
jgi:hypothetical protein